MYSQYLIGRMIDRVHYWCLCLSEVTLTLWVCKPLNLTPNKRLPPTVPVITTALLPVSALSASFRLPSGRPSLLAPFLYVSSLLRLPVKPEVPARPLSLTLLRHKALNIPYSGSPDIFIHSRGRICYKITNVARFVWYADPVVYRWTVENITSGISCFQIRIRCFLFILTREFNLAIVKSISRIRSPLTRRAGKFWTA